MPATVKVTTTTSADGRVTERVEIQVYDRLGALDKLMRHLGGYEDRLKVDGTVGFPGPPPPEVVKLVEEALGRPLPDGLPKPPGLHQRASRAEPDRLAGAT